MALLPVSEVDKLMTKGARPHMRGFSMHSKGSQFPRKNIYFIENRQEQKRLGDVHICEWQSRARIPKRIGEIVDFKEDMVGKLGPGFTEGPRVR